MRANNPDRMPITGVVLAGGKGRRMGGVDKGLQLFRGRTLIDLVLERIGPQVTEILINANQNRERYEAYGCTVSAILFQAMRVRLPVYTAH